MQNKAAFGWLLAACILVAFFPFAAESSGAVVTVRSQMAVDLELVGYAGLSEIPLVSEKVPAQGSTTIETSYTGLSVLVFSRGQSYPLLLGDESFALHIEDPSGPPSFTGSPVNEYFYAQLTGNEQETGPGPDNFARLMLRTKQLLESSYSIRTVAELAAKKKEFRAFVRDHYEQLRHSDMIRRLIAQYFMMHEYADYHVEDAPVSDIKTRYRQSVLDGVSDWLETLRLHIPEHEILNYCVSLYYQRSMVTMAAVITDNFPDIAYCPGTEKEEWELPGDVLVADAGKNQKMHLRAIKSDKIITFVSDDCPVSMVETVAKARQLATQDTGEKLIVAPLQQLSETHLAMNMMVSGGNMLFIDDEQWRKEHLPEKIRLPLFVQQRGRLPAPP